VSRSAFFAASWLIALLADAGCSPNPKLPTVPAAGTVTYKGEPVEGAEITFMPLSPESGKPALAVTDAQGRFTLQTSAGGTAKADGALVGEYSVTVVKRLLGPSPVTQMSQSDWKHLPKEEQDKMRAGHSMGPSADETASATGDARKDLVTSKVVKDEKTSQLPAKYADPNRSDLLASVKAGDPNDFTFDLLDD